MEENVIQFFLFILKSIPYLFKILSSVILTWKFQERLSGQKVEIVKSFIG